MISRGPFQCRLFYNFYPTGNYSFFFFFCLQPDWTKRQIIIRNNYYFEPEISGKKSTIKQLVWSCSNVLLLLSSAQTCVYSAATLPHYSPEASSLLFLLRARHQTRQQTAAITEIVAKVWSQEKWEYQLCSNYTFALKNFVISVHFKTILSATKSGKIVPTYSDFQSCKDYIVLQKGTHFFCKKLCLYGLLQRAVTILGVLLGKKWVYSLLSGTLKRMMVGQDYVSIALFRM